MTINELNKIILTKTGKIKRNAKEIINNSNEIINFCKITYKDYFSIEELLYRIKHNIYNKPLCPVCGNELQYLIRKGCFQKHCCYSCANKDPEKIKLTKQTKLERHGSETYNNRQKCKETCISKYGCENALSNTEIRNKIYQTKLEKYGSIYFGNPNKAKQTNLIKYGHECAMQSDKIQEKIKEKFIEKYNVNNFLKSEEFKQYRNTPEVQEKISKTKRKNHTFNTSKDEEKIFNLLKIKFNNIERSFKSSKYPFNCDFYILDIDTYIEINFHWTHGKHPFDSLNIDDIERLNFLKEKNSKYYNIAINTWTARDVNKRNIAKQNNLKYFEFFNWNEFNNWFNNI